MKQRSSNALAIAAAAAALVIVLGQPLRAEVLEGTKTVGGTTVYHKTVLPNGYDPAKAYPAILAFGGGPQTMNTVDNILNRNFRAEAEKRGYIVFAPTAPDGELFFEDGARVFPEFLKMILAEYKIHNTSYPLLLSLDTCGNPAQQSFRRSRRCAFSCTSASLTRICGTAR